MHVADRLQAAVEASGSLACVGLDPRPALLPPFLRQRALTEHGDTPRAVATAFLAFNQAIIDAIAGHCAAVKPQMACYEAYGAEGWRCLAETIAHARDRGLEVILDGKRNDIGSSAAHYADMAFAGPPGLAGPRLPGLGGDWLTVNGWLGSDGLTPFLSDPPGDRGVFVLVRTSNPGGAEIQQLALAGGGNVAGAMADRVAGWAADRLGHRGLADVGAVVGATHPEEARALRQAMPDSWFLVPGYGAQGAGAADALAGRRTLDGGGVIVNNSRGIIGAWQHTDVRWAEDDWAGAARAALETMNRDLASAR